MMQAELAKQQKILKDMGSFLGLEDQNLEVSAIHYECLADGSPPKAPCFQPSCIYQQNRRGGLRALSATLLF